MGADHGIGEEGCPSLIQRPVSTSQDSSAQDTPRYVVRLPGRMLIPGEVEQTCVLEAVQGREAFFRITLPPVSSQRGKVVAYVDLIGRIEGSALRIDHDRIAFTIAAPNAKMVRLHQQFALIASMPENDREELRGHRRIVPDMRDISILLPRGIIGSGWLRDLSRSGAAVQTSSVVAVGDRVLLGTTRATCPGYLQEASLFNSRDFCL